MTKMVIDGLTAALLTPALAREGWTLADFANSMRNAMTGGYSRIHLKQLKRDAEAADFVVDERGGTTRLNVPGVDAFSDPADCLPLKGVPPMWGSVLRIDGRLELRPNAVRCHPRVIAMPSRATGRFLLLDTDLPEAIRIAAAGRPLGQLLSISGADLPDVPVKEVRGAREDDFRRIEIGDGGTFRIGTAAPPPIRPQGIVVSVAAGDPVSVDAG